MCGIVGVAGDLSSPEERIFEFLLRLDTMRGPHSTGVFRLDKFDQNQPGGRIIKGLGTPWDMERNSNDFRTMYQGFSRLFLGHNRFATKGAILASNAHPFRKGKIIGVHNGTLLGQHLLPDSHKFEVDSENIIHALDSLGVEETFKKLNGSYALVWYNTEEMTLNFCRNSQRDLYYAKSVDGKVLIWASESFMITAAQDKFKRAFQPPVLFEPGHHYSIILPPFSKAATLNTALPELTKNPVEVYVSNYQGSYSYYNNNYGMDDDYPFPMGPTARRRIPQQQQLIGNRLPIITTPPAEDKSVFYTKHVGKVVRFKVTHSVISSTNPSQSYLMGLTSEILNVKVNLDSNTDMFKKYRYNGVVLEGRVKHIKRDDSGLISLIVKPSTLKMISNNTMHKNTPYSKIGEISSEEETKEDHSRVIQFPNLIKHNQHTSASEEESPPEDNPIEEAGVVDLSPVLYVVGTSGRLVDCKEAKRILDNGCCMCGDPLFLSELMRDTIEFVSITNNLGEDPVCRDCVNMLNINKSKLIH